LTEAVGKESGWNASEREYHEQTGGQGAKLRVAYAEMLPQKREQRIQNLTIGKVDKID
jgi:hypothetical protein